MDSPGRYSKLIDPRWLLQLQLLHLHSSQQERVGERNVPLSRTHSGIVHGISAYIPYASIQSQGHSQLKEVCEMQFLFRMAKCSGNSQGSITKKEEKSRPWGSSCRRVAIGVQESVFVCLFLASVMRSRQGRRRLEMRIGELTKQACLRAG